MLNLHVLQAAYGDCLFLEFGSHSPRYILIDGGPPDTYGYSLKPFLSGLAEQGLPLDLVLLSHVDNDHVIGLLDYFAQLGEEDNQLPIPSALWLNSFSATLDPDHAIQPRLTALLALDQAGAMSESAFTIEGVKEGHKLRTLALLRRVPINTEFDNQLITVETAPRLLVFDDVELIVIGPTQANLDALRGEWMAWLSKQENLIDAQPFVLSNSDRSIPNLSSITLLARTADRTILLTGDARSDHLLSGLKQANLLDANGQLHVNVLKLPHHGSSRNITKSFFKQITADVYVASANGKDGNPDLATLIWLVEAAQEQGRKVEIVATNDTSSLQSLVSQYPPATYNFTLRLLQTGETSLVV